MRLISGPCVVENYETTYLIAERLKEITDRLGVDFVFKASFDKANRTSINSFRGASDALGILEDVGDRLDIRVTTDVHTAEQVLWVSLCVDVLQIPAFLCRQTDLLVAAGESGLPVNIKKGQFMSPWEMSHVVDKVRSTGNTNVTIIERGTTFGYNNLVVDMRGIPIMRSFCPVIMDATHSVQLPGGGGSCSGGQREFVPVLAKAAIAAGADGVFMEVHPDPDRALCDGPNSLRLDDVEGVLTSLIELEKCS